MAEIPAYIRDPEAIYALSFERVRQAVDLGRFPKDVAEIVLRVVHSCGMPEIAEDIVYSDNAGAKAVEAIRAGAPIICDCAMVAAGITRRFLPADNEIIMSLNDDGVAAKASALGTTRSAAAVEFWQPWLEGAVVAIGNAPTALFHLLELLKEGWPLPAVILAFPVGFVGAAESKAELAANPPLNSAYLCLKGTRGGSAMASASVNAAALLAGRAK
jgi:precorrin-8X/cobalt-precorrin-8 methylmutase